MSAAVAAALLALPALLSTGGGDPRPCTEDPWGCLRDGRAEAAAEVFAERVERARDPAVAADAAAGRIRALIRLDRWREAREEALGIPAELAAFPGVTAAIGEAMLRAGELERAETLLAPLAELETPPARALVALGRLRQARGRLDEALSLRERALETDAEDREVLFWASELAPTRGEAIELLEGFLARSDGAEEERVASARSAIAVYRSLGEREVWRQLTSPERVELPLTRIWNDRGRVLGFVVKVRVGPKRKPVKLLLDTGSNGVFLVERMALRRGFESLAEETVFGGGGDRRHTTRRGLFPRFEVGELVFEDALVSTTPEELEPQGRFHGVLGISVFAGWRVTLDLPGERLLLDRGPAPAGASPYWTVAGQMLVRAGAPDGPEGMFLFDTGATGTFVARSFAERLEDVEWGAPVEVRTFGGRMESRLVAGIELAFQGIAGDGRALSVVDLSLRSRLGRVEISGYLGLDLWQKRRVVIDTVSRQVSVAAISAR